MRRAPLLRRAAAASIDLVVPVGTAASAAALWAELPYSAPSGWFLSEWLLKVWLDHPGQLVGPVVVLVSVFLVWQFAWESVRGRTPGAALVGLEIVDAWGDPIEWPRALGRFAGGIGSVATAGLGWCWIWVDPEGRGLPDRVAGTWVVVADDGRLGRAGRAGARQT